MRAIIYMPILSGMSRTITENMLYNIKNNCSKICICQKKVVPLQRENKNNNKYHTCSNSMDTT